MYEIMANGINITDRIVSLEFCDEIVSKEYIIGNSVSTEVKLKLINRDGLLQELKDHPFIINSKSYYIYNKPEKWDGTVDITLYDCMLRLNAVYVSSLAYPTTVREQLQDISNQVKVVIDISTLSDSILNKIVDFYDTSTLMRDIVNDICQCDGKNALVVNDIIKFHDLCTQTHQLDITASHTVVEEINYTRVLCDRGIKVLSAGTSEGSTIYLRSSNRYVAQEDIDRIYAKYKYLQFSSLSSLKCRDIPGISLTSLIEYDDMRFIPFYIKRTVYGGDAVDMLEIDGEVSTKEQESIVKEKDVGESIKKLEVNIDHNNQSIEIIAKEQEGIKTSVTELELSVDEISLKVIDTEESIYKFESGTGNIFENCNQYISKNKGDEGEILSSDMPLGINKDYLRGKDICIAVDVKVINAQLNTTLGNYVGAEFSVGYKDGTKKSYQTRWYLGQFSLQYLLTTATNDCDKRIYQHFKIEDKEITSVSNLKIIISLDADKAVVANAKVEFGEYPTGYQFDVPYIRDNITVIQKDYTQIKQEVSTLSLQAVSMEQEITTIKGDTTTLTTRLNSAEIRLQPTNILLAVNEQIGANGKLYSTKFILDLLGVHISGGGLDISNNAGAKVFYADVNGNLVINNLTANNGYFSGNITGSTISGGNISGTNITGGTITGNTSINVGTNLTVGNNIYVGSYEDKNTKKFIYLNSRFSVASRNEVMTIGVSAENIVFNPGSISITNAGSIYARATSYLRLESKTSDNVQQSITIYDTEIQASSSIRVSSDARKKENFRNVKTSWIYNLLVKEFKYKTSNDLSIGLIAQDYIGYEWSKYFLHMGKDDFYSIDYQNIFSAMIQEMQILRKDLNSTYKEIAMLKSQIGGIS